ncbi:hypothetical protein DPMN_189209 [Dreissena polymorpha]|uniref:Uncharacterized protein n=1 Tax=Dreissena polymorpha TaxID=45954 RepID=A0A9D4DV60_DREPO|nr:hypothetical protein DPMN_189209 [Dreissena polymorpha]
MGVGGAIAGYSFISAYDCQKEAKQRIEQAAQIRKDIESIKWKMENTDTEKGLKEKQTQSANTLIGT